MIWHYNNRHWLTQMGWQRRQQQQRQWQPHLGQQHQIHRGRAMRPASRKPTVSAIIYSSIICHAFIVMKIFNFASKESHAYSTIHLCKAIYQIQQNDCIATRSCWCSFGKFVIIIRNFYTMCWKVAMCWMCWCPFYTIWMIHVPINVCIPKCAIHAHTTIDLLFCSLLFRSNV